MYQHMNQSSVLFIHLFLFQIGGVLICVGLLSPIVLNALMGDIQNAIQTMGGSGATNDPQSERRKNKLKVVLNDDVVVDSSFVRESEDMAPQLLLSR